MGKGRGRPDPFDVYREWLEHRYDPGYYLGGNIEPDLRRSYLGPRARRHSGALLFGSGALGLLTVIAGTTQAVSSDVPGIVSRLSTLGMLAFCGLLIAAGVSMYRSGGPSRRGRRRDRRSERQRADSRSK